MSASAGSTGAALPPRLVIAGTPFPAPAALSAVPEALAAVVTVHATGQWVATGPGLLLVRDRVWIVLPRAYGATPPAGAAENAERAALLVSSLARYRHETPAQRAVADDDGALRDPLVTVGEAADLVDQVEAALLLWADYQREGPLIPASPRVTTRHAGRALWPRTVREGAPLHGRGGVVFQQVFRSRVRPDPDHELALVHRGACAEVGARFGLGHVEVEALPTPREALQVVARQERSCFADRPRRLVALLRRYYAARAAAGRGSDRVQALLARRFEYVWERMLQVALRHEGGAEELTGRYHLPGGAGSLAGLRLRPDLLTRARLHDGRQVLLVLDAKDYAADHWPSTPDLSKQILYRLLLSDRVRPGGLPLEAIGNAFLFPAVDPQRAVRVRGVHRLKQAGGLQAGRPGWVAGLDVDLERVTRAYLAGRADEALRREVAEEVFATLAE